MLTQRHSGARQHSLLICAIVSCGIAGTLTGCHLLLPYQTAASDGSGPADGSPVEPDATDPDADASRTDAPPTEPCTKSVDCDDRLDCTTDSCLDDQCTHSVAADACFIDQTCRVRYEQHPDDRCLRCDPTVSTTTWTEVRRCVRTIAGVPNSAAKPGDPLEGPAASTRFYFPVGLVVDAQGGGVLVADCGTHRIRRVVGGVVRTFAGSELGFENAPTPAAALFSCPTGLAFDSNGGLIIADRNNRVIRRIDRTGVVVTYAGDGGEFTLPQAVAVNALDHVLVADAENHAIYLVDGPMVQLVAGTPGTSGYVEGAAKDAQFSQPTGIAVGLHGQIYVADRGNNRIRVIHNGVVDTVAGTGDFGYAEGAAGVAEFRGPAGIAAEGGVIYVADSHNHRIRAITSPLLDVSLVAGAGYGNRDGPAPSALFNNPVAVAVASDGTLFVAERTGHVIRSITPP